MLLARAQRLLQNPNLTPQQRAQLTHLTHRQLLKLREMLPQAGPAQNLAALAEHQAYARERAAEGPLQALSVGISIPAYSTAKALGLTGGRSPATWEEVGAGFQGLSEGVQQWWNQ
jgi:hypothetical protein